MGKVLFLYTSLTGNTETMAEEMLKQLEKYDHHVTAKSFAEDEVEVEELLNYDAIVIGIYTWVDGDVPFEVEEFFDDLEEIDLTGKICGTFGSADTDYEPLYGTATEMLHEQLESLGATMLEDNIIFELEPDEDELERSRKLIDSAIERMEQK